MAINLNELENWFNEQITKPILVAASSNKVKLVYYPAKREFVVSDKHGIVIFKSFEKAVETYCSLTATRLEK